MLSVCMRMYAFVCVRLMMKEERNENEKRGLRSERKLSQVRRCTVCPEPPRRVCIWVGDFDCSDSWTAEGEAWTLYRSLYRLGAD